MGDLDHSSSLARSLPLAELARDKAFDWAMVTAEDLGERIQAFAICMAELVGVDEVERGGEP